MVLLSKHDVGRFLSIEPGLHYANSNYITVDKNEAEFNTKVVEKIVERLIRGMKRNSRSFASLYSGKFGGGSNYDGLKVGTPEEFDIDILFVLPECTNPVLKPNNRPGYVNLQLETFEDLQQENAQLYKDLATFVDDKNYLLTANVKSFMQGIFTRAINELDDGSVTVGGEIYKISRVQKNGPALTLTIEGDSDFCVQVDLVPCFLLEEDQWPGGAFRPNPYNCQLKENSFFIVPKSPNAETNHDDRYWRLSFQIQEREIIFNRMWLKPTLKIIKRIRDNLGHKVSSYAIKTIFLWDMVKRNPSLDDEIPDFWSNNPLSYCLLYMLRTYAAYLGDGNIWYFWNKKLNLLENLRTNEIDKCLKDIKHIIADIEANPDFSTIVKYLGPPDGIRRLIRN